MKLKILSILSCASLTIASPCLDRFDACTELFDADVYDSGLETIDFEDVCKHLDLFVSSGKDKELACFLSKETSDKCPPSELWWVGAGVQAEIDLGVLENCPSACLKACTDYKLQLQNLKEKVSNAEDVAKACTAKVEVCEKDFDKTAYTTGKTTISPLLNGCEFTKLAQETGQLERLDCLTNDDTVKLCQGNSFYELDSIAAGAVSSLLRCPSECQTDCELVKAKFAKFAKEEPEQVSECQKEIEQCDLKFDLGKYLELLQNLTLKSEICKFIDIAADSGWYERMECMLSTKVSSACAGEEEYWGDIGTDIKEECPAACSSDCEKYKSQWNELKSSGGFTSSAVGSVPTVVSGIAIVLLQVFTHFD